MDLQARLVRYRVQAANRRHFEGLFFAVIAFGWLFALALWTALTALHTGHGSFALAGSGAIMIGAAFVAHRLLRRERSAFAAMVSAWEAITGEAPSPPPSRRGAGAMEIAVAGMALTGGVLVTAGAVQV